jgi:hypothetical protein
LFLANVLHAAVFLCNFEARSVSYLHHVKERGGWLERVECSSSSSLEDRFHKNHRLNQTGDLITEGGLNSTTPFAFCGCHSLTGWWYIPHISETDSEKSGR